MRSRYLYLLLVSFVCLVFVYSEALPKDLDVNTTFGSIKAKTTVDGDKIIYIQDIDIISGRYNRSQYTEVKDFFAQITAAVKRNIVLKKL